MPLKTTGVAIGCICWPISGTRGDPAVTWAISGAEVKAGFGNRGFHSALASSVKDTARASLRFSRSFPCSKISIICLIGVMPQIGSFENGKL
jgi:hypothetical protein